ncbi:Vegetative incompatibility protein HET-E-1 [Beauveria bassiana]|nr:Vegetative incompatibility protein HET-E-1 [Beauveria bassiana]
MPVKNSSGCGFCAVFWNKIRRKKSPSRSESISSLKTESVTKTNPQTPGDNLAAHKRPLLGELITINSTKQRLSKDCSLWDQAYNALEERDPDGIFKAYHVIFSRLYAEFNFNSPGRATPSPPAPHGGSRSHAPILPSFENPLPRRELLSAVASLGLQQMKDKEIAIRLWGHELHPNNAITDTISVMEALQKIVQDAVRDLPNAAMAMAGVSLVLPLLLNPSTAENDNLRGFDYVTSQMSYYIEMEVLFLPVELQVSLRDELKRQIKALYEKIIEYEIRSVLHFFSSRVTRFFKGSILFDDWRGKLDEIQTLETTVLHRLKSAVSGESMKHLSLLKEDAKLMRQGVDSIVSELHTASNVLQRLERLELDKEDQKYLASLLATDPRLAKRALQSAKEQPLRDSYEWIFGDEQFKQWQTNNDKNQLWISGDPGKGKTMLLCGIIDNFTIQKNKQLNVAFFFCQATDASFNNANAVVRGLLYMLVKQQPALMTHIRKSCQNGMGKRQFRGTTAWEALSVVFTEVLNDPMLDRTYLIVDALDECVNDQLCLLKLILATSHLKGAKWLLSSRNDLIWPQVDDQELCDESTVPLATRRVHLKLEDKQDSIATSIDAYILNAVGSLKEKKQLDDFNVDLIKHHLVQNAEGTFLWVALVCKALAHPDVLGGDIKRQLASLPKGLKPLYSEMLKRIRHSEYESLYRQLLSIMSAVFRPVTFVELRALSSQLLKDYDDGDLEQRIARCGSFLTVKDKIVSFVHKSAKDYLLGEESIVAGSLDVSAQHYTVFLAALELLTSTLRRNMCNLELLGPLSERDSQPDLEPLMPISYATVFWLDHFKNSAFRECFDPARQKEAAGLVCNFLKEKYLYWLEALRNLSHVMGPLKELSGFMGTIGV